MHLDEIAVVIITASSHEALPTFVFVFHGFGPFQRFGDEIVHGHSLIVLGIVAAAGGMVALVR